MAEQDPLKISITIIEPNNHTLHYQQQNCQNKELAFDITKHKGAVKKIREGDALSL